MELRLLSALEVLQARREAEELSRQEGEPALCANACLLARALERSETRQPVFASGQEVLSGMTVEEIAALAGRWDAFCRRNDPGLDLGREELEDLKSDCLVLDLASKPGGVDLSAAGELGLTVIWALSLPGKVAPVTAGAAIKTTIYNMLHELGY